MVRERSGHWNAVSVVYSKSRSLPLALETLALYFSKISPPWALIARAMISRILASSSLFPRTEKMMIPDTQTTPTTAAIFRMIGLHSQVKEHFLRRGRAMLWPESFRNARPIFLRHLLCQAGQIGVMS